MICYICDKTLSQDEIKLHPLIHQWEPCGECLQIIQEVWNDLDEDEIRRELEFEDPVLAEDLVQGEENTT